MRPGQPRALGGCASRGMRSRAIAPGHPGCPADGLPKLAGVAYEPIRREGGHCETTDRNWGPTWRRPVADEVRQIVQVSQSHADRGWRRRWYSGRMALSARDRRRRITPTVPVGGAERLGAGEITGRSQAWATCRLFRMVPGYHPAGMRDIGFLCWGVENPVRGIVYAVGEWKQTTRRLPWRSTAALRMVGTADTEPAKVCKALRRR
jgi:hypothetical protein